MTKRLLLPLFLAVLLAPAAARPAENGWIDLIGDKELESWKEPRGAWQIAGDAEIDPQNPRLLKAKPGKGVIVNGPKGNAPNLFSKQPFQDVEAHFEFMVPKRSNSGVKFEGLYEIQIFDSFGVKKPTASDCGGIYPRAELKPTYHHIDKGTPPRTNASKPAGEWQTLDVIFQVPRFNDQGKKTANARFVKVVFNGEIIHENVDMPYPTGHAWQDQQVPTGPILLQGDHGSVAFRNIRARTYSAKAKSD